MLDTTYSGSVYEHSFHIEDAEHTIGTNKYMFSYPEIWTSSQNSSDLSLGVRSIILKTGTNEINLSYLSLISKHAEGAEGYTNSSGALTARPYYAGSVLFNDRIRLDITASIEERVSMTQLIRDIKEQFNHIHTKWENHCHSSTYAANEIWIDESQMCFTYSVQGDFLISVRNNDKYTIETSITDLTNKLVFSPQFHNTFCLPMNDTDLNKILYDLALVTKILLQKPKDLIPYTGIETPVEKNNKDIQNDIIVDENAALVLNKQRALEDQKKLSQDTSKYGVEFKGVRFSNLMGEKATFESLVIHNVWSREDVLIKSSIAELDTMNYLGYSTNSASSTSCVYAQPKVYEIRSGLNKFWIKLFDSHTNKPLELPDHANLIVESCLFQNDKRVLSR